MSQLSIKEMYQILGELIKDGYGDKQFQIYYDSETAYTTIPKKSRIFVFKQGIRFSDYAEPFIAKDRLIEGILEEINTKKIDYTPDPGLRVTYDEINECHMCKHLKTDRMLRVHCDINDADFLTNNGDCQNFEDYREYLDRRL